MRKPGLVAAAVAVLVLIGAGAWFGVRALTATGALAGSADTPPVMMIGAKGAPTALYDDYDIVTY